MSDGDKKNSDEVSQDLEPVATVFSKSKNSFFEDVQEAKDTQNANEYDRSLANIHTGSEREYEQGETKQAFSDDLERGQGSAGENLPETFEEKGKSEASAIASERQYTGETDQDANPSNLYQGRPSQNGSFGQENEGLLDNSILLDSSQSQVLAEEGGEKLDEEALIIEAAAPVIIPDLAPDTVALDDNAVDENSSIGTVVGTVSAEDPEGGHLTYSLSDDGDGKFTIDATTGEIKVAGALDHEDVDSYTITVDVSDGTNVTPQDFTIEVNDLDAPVISGEGNTIESESVGEMMDLSNMDLFPELSTRGNLEAKIGNEAFEDMISDAEGVVVNCQSDATITFQGEGAGYRNSIGAYQIDEDGTINNVQLMWGDASSNKLTSGESTATYEGIDAGNQLGFFVISNGFASLPDDAVSGDGNTISETGTWMYVSPDFDPATDVAADSLYNVNTDSGAPKLIYVEEDGTTHTQSGNVFHSLNQSEFNGDRATNDGDHFVAGVDQDNGILNFGFEDLWGGGDKDYNDGMFSVELDARDLIDTPNPLFSEDGAGKSSFQIADTDSTELSSATVTLGDMVSGDVLTVGGGYTLDGADINLPDGTYSGVSVVIEDDGSAITASFSGTASIDIYESIIQSINFSNETVGEDISGDRSIDVTVTDTSGENSETFTGSLTVESDETEASAGDDTLYGTDGDDIIHGQAGDDVLSGGAGDDQVYGDAGSDIFYFASDQGNDTFHGGDGGGWSDTIVLSDGVPAGDINDWLSLDSGSVESTADGEIFLTEDASGTINVGGVELTFDGIEKIEG